MMSDRSAGTWTWDDRGCHSGAGRRKVSARANVNRSSARFPRMYFSLPEYTERLFQREPARARGVPARNASSSRPTDERDIEERA
jgi:hypothetical protein